jgi:hypothetical protein
MSEPNNDKAKPSPLETKYVINGHDGVKYLIFHHKHPSNGEFVVFVDRVVALLQSNAWPLGRCRPPTVLAMGQNRQKTGKACLLTPSSSSGRMGPE